MSKIYFVRTEPRTTSSNLEPGIAARVHDPAWMLGRQWQLGELLGEDAGSPVSVTLDAETAILTKYRTQSRADWEDYDPFSAPLELMAEAAPQRAAKVWTARLRIDTGRAFLRALEDAGLGQHSAAFREAFKIAPADEAVRVADRAGARLLDVAAGRIPDGAQLFHEWAPLLRQNAPLPDVPGVAPSDAQAVRKVAIAWLDWCDGTLSERESTNAWQPESLDYAFSVATDNRPDSAVIQATGYRGGSLEWHSFDVQSVAKRSGFVAQPTLSVVPTGVRFRGMPNARWWEFEDATIDLGSVDAGASDVARLAFLEFALVYGNDFFAVPVRLPVGSLTRVTSLVVADTFGMRLSIGSANRRQGKQGTSRFSLFALTERDPRTPASDALSDLLLMAPVAGQILSSASVEDVLLLRDEMANLAWAVERRYEGERGLAVERHEATLLAAPEAPPPNFDADLRYALGTSVPPYWFPLIPTAVGAEVRLVLSRMTNQPPSVVPLGQILNLNGPSIPDADVPREGTRLLRDFAMTRWTNGATFVWSRRRREIGRGEGSSGLRFDVAERPTT